MSLYDSFEQTQPGQAATTVTLQKMSAVPSVTDLMLALSTAQQNQTNIVELPWKSNNNPNNYIIKVTCSINAEEPTWFLHLGGDEDQPVLWNYETVDATLIHTLVLAECERTKYTAPIEQEPAGLELPLPDLSANNAPYLPREHEQHLPTTHGRTEVNTSLEWSDQMAPSASGYSLPPGNTGQPAANYQAGLPPPTVALQPAPGPANLQYTANTQTPSSEFPMTNEELSRQSVATAPRPLPAPVDLDRSAVDSIYKSFTNPDTGFISHGAFLFFLVNEFNRFQKDPKPLSVVRLDLCIRPMSPESTITPVPQKTLQEAGKRIFSVMRPLDWAAHYEQEFALLMPFTTRAEAGQLAQRIAHALTQAPLVPGLDPKMLGISMGVASMPEDCTHPGILLAAAQEAKTRARKAGVPVMLFNDGI
ncbi:MAG: diguanylate cyclase [Cyanobacteria bacterium SZAS LIN-5]|nr:diguanylate cyclase [Cyanobacteria bacterium SZAS LIN-5]